MIGRLALRSLTAHPVRSLVLATGFGAGVAVMAILLGVAEIVLEQAQSPALAGGGDVIVRLSRQVPARVLMAGTLQGDALRDRVRVAAPSHATDLFLIGEHGATRVDARGGIPSLERALGDPEVAAIGAWRDLPRDVTWIERSPEAVLRQIDRFHPVPDAPEWEASWAEWLYFNGRSPDARFYLTFLAGPRLPDGGRAARVRLQLQYDGELESFGASATVTETDLQRAPDLAIGASSVRLEGMRYRVRLDLPGENGRRATGDLTIEASPGRLMPPFEVAGTRGWTTGYVVPVMSGRLAGTIAVVDPAAGVRRLSLDGGTGYHDHNWGFWEGVSWQWGQVQHGDLSLLYGRVFPPADAADPERLPGLVAGLDANGPLGFATDVQIEEVDDELGRPRTITIHGRGTAFDLTLRLDVTSTVASRMAEGGVGDGLTFLQMRGQYTVTGRAGARDIQFTAPGSAETFRGGPDP